QLPHPVGSELGPGAHHLAALIRSCFLASRPATRQDGARMVRRRRLLAVALCLALSSVATGKAPVRKPPLRVVLDYRRLAGADTCPTKSELEARVTDILGRSPFARRAPRTVRCMLRAEGSGLAARVQLLDTRSGRVLGVRELSGTGPGCEELGGAVAFAIALAIDPLARPPRAPPAASVSATPPLQASEPSAPPSASSSVVGSAASAAGAGAVGASGAPRTGPPTRSGRAPDAGPLLSLGLVPLVAQLVDAGPPPRAPADAGLAGPDAGTVAADAGVPSGD